MAIAMIMRWDGVSVDQYNAIRDIVRWEDNRPQGVLFHVAGHDGSALRVTDIWEAPEYFDTFAQQRLLPAVQQVGITGEPQVEVYPVHTIYNPAVGTGVTQL